MPGDRFLEFADKERGRYTDQKHIRKWVESVVYKLARERSSGVAWLAHLDPLVVANEHLLYRSFLTWNGNNT